jgi:hypothetical protein
MDRRSEWIQGVTSQNLGRGGHSPDMARQNVLFLTGDSGASAKLAGGYCL